jgi:hypothetical protein
VSPLPLDTGTATETITTTIIGGSSSTVPFASTRGKLHAQRDCQSGVT